jgi:hypothetical protein
LRCEVKHFLHRILSNDELFDNISASISEWGSPSLPWQSGPLRIPRPRSSLIPETTATGNSFMLLIRRRMTFLFDFASETPSRPSTDLSQVVQYALGPRRHHLPLPLPRLSPSLSTSRSTYLHSGCLSNLSFT